MENLAGRASSRFVFVTLLPTVLLLGLVAFLLAAGAPFQTPSISMAESVLAAVTWRQLVVAGFVVLAVAVATHTLQTPVIQLLEGYWQPFPVLDGLASRLTERHERIYRGLRRSIDDPGADALAVQRGGSAAWRLDWYPDDESKLLPTSLGNTLRAGEERVAARYGLDSSVVVPRLLTSLSKYQSAGASDRRMQLDAAARLCATSLLGVVIAVVLLLPTRSWLWLPLVLYLFAWATYRAAVSAARGYCSHLSALVDLHQREFWKAISIRAPASLRDSQALSPVVMSFLRGEDLDDEAAEKIRWI